MNVDRPSAPTPCPSPSKQMPDSPSCPSHPYYPFRPQRNFCPLAPTTSPTLRPLRTLSPRRTPGLKHPPLLGISRGLRLRQRGLHPIPARLLTRLPTRPPTRLPARLPLRFSLRLPPRAQSRLVRLLRLVLLLLRRRHSGISLLGWVLWHLRGWGWVLLFEKFLINES